MRTAFFVLAMLAIPFGARASVCELQLQFLSDVTAYNQPLAVLTDEARDAAADAINLNKGTSNPNEESESYRSKVEGRPAKIDLVVSAAYAHENLVKKALALVEEACK